MEYTHTADPRNIELWQEEELGSKEEEDGVHMVEGVKQKRDWAIARKKKAIKRKDRTEKG